MTFGSIDLANMRPPGRVEELGIPLGMAEDLFMRRVLTERVTSIGQVAEALHVLHPVADALASALREKQLIEYLGATGRDYRIQLTEGGHRTTAQRMESGRHVGGIPVPLADYSAVVNAQQSEVVLDRELMRNVFADMVIADELLDRIGPAFVGDGAMFLYGPAGTGKTSIAERLNRVFEDPVLIPRHIETDGQIIAVYDPSLHRALDHQPEHLDPRWVLCERPLVVVGGELDMMMLDLQHDSVSGINVAPIQLLANNGILVVDDFGRQAIQPDAILNRWIVPLSRGIDYLKVNTGTKFTVPFALKLVISTNMDPMALGDDAFLRRLRNKVFIGAVTEDAFVQILKGAAERHSILLTTGAPEYLGEITRHRVGQLRPYVAVDFCELTAAACRYERSSPVLNADMIDRIADLYFVQETDTSTADSSRPRSLSQPQARRRELDQWSLDNNGDDSRRVPQGWHDYEIGARSGDNPMAGLEALADTQSVDGGQVQQEVPSVLQSSPNESNGHY